MSRRKSTKQPPGRSKTTANEQGKGFGQISRVMIESAAYKAISSIPAAKALPVFIVKFSHAEATTGRPECQFHYSEAETIHGIPRKSFARGLPELHALGFIDAVAKGGEWAKNQWTPTVFRKSERWRKYGTADFVSVPWIKSEPSHTATPPPRKRREDGKI